MTSHYLSLLIPRQAEKYGDRVALRYRDYETAQWLPITWREFAHQVKLTANALAAVGVGIQENIGIFSQNKPECLFVDFAAFANRAVTIPLYATSSPAQAQYIINDASIRYLFVGEQYQYDAAFSIIGLCHSIKQLVLFDRTIQRDARDTTSVYFDDFIRQGEGFPYQAQIDERTNQADPDDLANILYTSGTTGEPKGVTLRHEAWEVQIEQHLRCLTTLTDRDVSLCFLPLTHVFERGWTYVCLSKGAEVCINLRPQDIQTTIKEVRPTVMCSVPRFWEKVYAGVQEKIAHESGVVKAMMLDALKVGREHNMDYVRLGKKPPLMLHLKYKFYERTVYALLKKTIGIDRGNFFPTAGAAVSVFYCTPA